MSDEDVRVAGQHLARVSIHDKKPLQEVQNLPLHEPRSPVKPGLYNVTPGKRETPVRSGSDSSPSLNDQVKYNSLIAKAKKFTNDGRVPEAMEMYKKALNLSYSEKLVKRIAKMEAYLKECSKESSEDDDGNMIDMGSGFYLFKDLFKKLYSHQKEGVLWMWKLFKRKKGGILGDDMGLGKTIQVIAFLSGMFDMDKVKSVLIINPVSVMSNWERECTKWAPGIKMMAFHGTSKKERERSLTKIQNRGGVLLTTYGMVITSWEQISQKDGREFVWDYVILDEGHKIKNPTKTTKGVHAIPAVNRIILTGTPVQNNLRELWALFDFVHQGSLLGTSRTFKMEYENPITRSREKDATNHDKKLGEEMAQSLKKIIEPYFLRRTKDEVQAKTQKSLNDPGSQQTDHAQMPSLTRKNDLVIWLFLSTAQQKIYEDFLALDSVKELLMTTKSPLVALTVLKKICDHPRLLSNRAIAQLGLNGEEGLDDSMSDHPLAMESAVTNIKNVDNSILINESGKLQVLIELVDNLKAEGHRCLIFSQSRKMLDIIQKIITDRGHRVMRLDGTVRLISDRDERIKRFQNDESYSVFLLTTQVGGVGLTLTAADRVIIYDPSWNPATDAQAVDRVFRIGQNKNIVIYRLVTCGSVEEKIYRRQIFKDSITRQTTGATKNPYRYFSKSELRELFILDNPRFSTTQEQLQDMHCNQRKSDVSLDAHIAYLHSLDIFGVSDHDLMFSQEAEPNEEMVEDGEHSSADYIQNRVLKAQELLQMESSLPSTLEERMGIHPKVNGEVRKQIPNKKPFNPQFGFYDLSPPSVVDTENTEQNDDTMDLTTHIKEETMTSEDTDIEDEDVNPYESGDMLLANVKQENIKREDSYSESSDPEDRDEMSHRRVDRTQTNERDDMESEKREITEQVQEISHAEMTSPRIKDRVSSESDSDDEIAAANGSLTPEQPGGRDRNSVCDYSENIEDPGTEDTNCDNQSHGIPSRKKRQNKPESPRVVTRPFHQSKSILSPDRGSGVIVEEELLISPDPSLPIIGLKQKRGSTLFGYSKALFPVEEKSKRKDQAAFSSRLTSPSPMGNKSERKTESTVFGCGTSPHPVGEKSNRKHESAVSNYSTGPHLVEKQSAKTPFKSPERLGKREVSDRDPVHPGSRPSGAVPNSDYGLSELAVNPRSCSKSPGSLLDRTLLSADTDARSESESNFKEKNKLFSCSPGSLINRTLLEPVFISPDAEQKTAKPLTKSPGSILSRTFMGSAEDSPRAGSSTSSSGSDHGRHLLETFVEDSPENIKTNRHAGHMAELVENTPDVRDASDLKCPDSDLLEEISSSFEFVNNSYAANDDGGDEGGTPVKRTTRRRSVCRKRVIESSEDESTDAKDDQSRPSSAELVQEECDDDSAYVDAGSRPESAMSVEGKHGGEKAGSADKNTEGGFLLQNDKEDEPSVNEIKNSSHEEKIEEDSFIDNDDNADEEHGEEGENGDVDAETESDNTDSDEEDEFDALPEKLRRGFNRLMDKGSELYKEKDLEGALIHILQALEIYEDPDAQKLAHKIEKKINKNRHRN
ncbi:DNA excision repair protein ERCC-6-like [Gigantopelta aegis]|uniref:DNA excision repair protein ERCC-6-like n=1 Tax=Gigantopelta aegis TaxID=1735272 RepID=UPI001B8882D6|nr:DNA excision repair protein ERCC-6-like [Gigantopelta aegis]